ncbi:MAG: hypothetical protein ACOYB7_02510 [Mycobacterium sp.]
MTELDPVAEQALADLSADDFDALVARVRAPEESVDHMQRAANALRSLRGLVDRTEKATHEQAAEALKRYKTGGGN